MKNKRIIDSWNKIKPDSDAEKHMLDTILARKHSVEKETRKDNYMKRCWNLKRLAPVAACIVLAVTISIPLLNNSSGDFTLSRSDKGIEVNYTDKLPEGVTSQDQLIALSEEQLYADTWDGNPIAAFAGTVKDIKYVDVDFGGKHYNSTWTIFYIEVEKTLRGDTKTGDLVSILITEQVNISGIWVEDMDGVSQMNIGTKGVFMPVKYDITSTYSTNGKTMCLLDVAQYGFLDGIRWVHLAQDEAQLDNVIGDVEAKIAQYN